MAEETARRVADLELKAMNDVVKALEPIDDDETMARVLTWVMLRFAPPDFTMFSAKSIASASATDPETQALLNEQVRVNTEEMKESLRRAKMENDVFERQHKPKE